ncbi:membrane protein containing TraG-like protein [Candidatus Desulfofervidus auxilii]|uniref:Membrane protein containing TraG-like protein n=1 Tax=Desulfofervidus auxilii TaxID=1621989 RepID=A0A7U4QK54_DESA2|nr:conjugal transfer protein TraG N-terminal domain-containing protein [Candidatus Desulfofervidus auxilii]AMM40838.1 membrane protein containing TraG-like protein [Candidatus Desulfofervidus auxilii]
MRRKFFLFFLFCIFLPAQAGAEEVFTFGNGDFIHEIIQAVATYCGGGEFGTLLKLMAVLALFAGLIKGLIVQTQGRGDMLSEAFKTFLMVLLLYYICFVPKTSVIIRDELFNTQTQVDDVPWGLAFMASLTTSIEKSIAKAFDTVYSIPDDLKFTESGYNFGLLALEGTLHQGVINPYIQHNWSCYIADCVVPAVLTGNINEAQLSWENDILGSNVLQTHYANFFTTHYDPNDGSVTHPSCRDDYATIKQETINHINSEIAPYFARRVAGIGGAASQWVQADVMNRLGAAGSYFLTLAGSGQQILQQAVMMNVINEARTSVMAQYATDPTALQVAQAIANLQARYSLSTGAEMAKTYVPALRRILEGIIYGIFPIIIAIAFVPFFRNALLKSYFYLFFWLIWWSPIFSVINLIVTTRGRSILSAYDGFFCLGNINPLANGFIDLVGVAGNLLWAVPILSFFIATGSVYAAVAGFRSLGAHVQALSHSAGVSTSPTPAGTSTMTRTGSELTTRETGGLMGLSWREMGQATARVSPMTMQGAFQRMYGMGTDWSGKVGNYAHSAGMGQSLGMGTGEIAGETTRGKLFGTLGAYHEAYTNGFRGSFTEFNKEMSNIATQTNFASARSVQNAANNSPFYQGNTQRLLQDQANFQMQRTATMLTTMREQGYSPETVGTALGGIRALENIASTDWAKQAGLRSVYTKKAGELYNELSKMTIRQALTDIAEKGSITPETQQILHNIAASPIGRAQLAAQGIGDRIIKPEEAKNVAMWLQSQGVDVSAKDLEGATAQMNVWTDKSGNIHMGFLATRKGKTVAEYDTKTTETGDVAKIHDREIQYTGGLQTTYSPAQSAAYNLFTGMLKGMGMNEAQAERYAAKAVASGWGSIRDARQIGALTNPAVAVAATALQGIDIANKVITDPDYKMVGNPMTAIKNMVTGKVATKINEVSDKAAGKLMNAPVVKEYRDMGEKLGEAVRNNDVKTVAQMHGWSEKQAQEYINTVHQHWDNALIKGKETQSFDFSDSMRILFPSNSQLLDFNKTKLPGTISRRRPHGG